MNAEELIKNSLQELQKIGWENESNSQDSKLIFPKYRNNKQRISEEEARFLFVRELEKQDNFYYSVETPTKEAYKDFNSEEPKIGAGRSGSVDVTLYEKTEDKYCRKHLIEFKLGNVKTCKKDFLKLLCDDNECKVNYYINILENCDSGTIPNLEKDKFSKSIDYIFKKYSKKIKSNLKIFVCILNDILITENNIIEYQIDNKNQSIKKR